MESDAPVPGPAQAVPRSARGLHAMLRGLVPGGVSREITAGQAARILGLIMRSGAVEAAGAGQLAGVPGTMTSARLR
jgi:hypothetical protein